MPISPLPKETATLRAVIQASGLRVIFTKHAREEMAKDEILSADVDRVLSFGVVTWVETRKEELWHIEGNDVDGRAIRLVVVVYPEEPAVKIVTAMAL